MKSKKLFRWIYLSFVAVLLALFIASVIGMNGLLKEYEANQPEQKVENAMEQLITDASSGGFWKKYKLPEVESNDFEKASDVKSKYLKLFGGKDVNYTVKNGTYAENELHYLIRNGKTELAEVTLKAEGEPITKLAVFTYRIWNVESIKPIFGKNDYTLKVPASFSVTANGVDLEKSGESTDLHEINYTVSGVYLEPVFVIKNENGKTVSYTVNNRKVIAEYYYYSFSLPETLTVSVNGKADEGVLQDNGSRAYDLRFLKKPDVVIKDLYGNSFSYEGRNIPLTAMKISVPEGFKVKANGIEVPKAARTEKDNPEFEFLADIVENLPKQHDYNVAILKSDAKITVIDANGKETSLSAESVVPNFMIPDYLDEVPKEVSSKVDVLDVAQSWSLFMSNDFDFKTLGTYMLPDSYQYKVARKYYNGTDKTFFSDHKLLDPAFTDNKVCNFTWITEDSFSVDISFVKHMRLNKTGKQVDDAMNDRFYFVYKDGKWLFAAMKEVTVDA